MEIFFVFFHFWYLLIYLPTSKNVKIANKRFRQKKIMTLFEICWKNSILKQFSIPAGKLPKYETLVISKLFGFP